MMIHTTRTHLRPLLPALAVSLAAALPPALIPTVARANPVEASQPGARAGSGGARDAQYIEGRRQYIAGLERVYQRFESERRQAWAAGQRAYEARLPEIQSRAIELLTREVYASGSDPYLLDQETNDPALKALNRSRNQLRHLLRRRVIDLIAYFSGRWDPRKRAPTLTDWEVLRASEAIQRKEVATSGGLPAGARSPQLNLAVLGRRMRYGFNGTAIYVFTELIEAIARAMQDNPQARIAGAERLIGAELSAPGNLYCADALGMLVQRGAELIGLKAEVRHSLSARGLAAGAREHLTKRDVLREPDRIGLYIVPVPRDGGAHVFGLLVTYDPSEKRFERRHINFNGVSRRNSSRPITRDEFLEKVNRAIDGAPIGFVTLAEAPA